MIKKAMCRTNWRRVLIVAAVTAAGLLLRLQGLENVHLWHDETDWFDEQIYDAGTMSLRMYAALKAQEHTVGPAWPLVVVAACKVFGPTAAAARMTSVFLGTAAIPGVFWLVYWTLRAGSRRKPFLPALLAASLTAMSMVQIEFSQRTYPFEAVSCLSAVLVILHLQIVAALEREDFHADRFMASVVLYALLAGFAAYTHLAFVLVLIASFTGLLWEGRRFTQWDRTRRVIVPCVGILVGLGVFWALFGHVLHMSQGPYRPYLASYYHPLNPAAVVFLVSRFYDLIVYHLNLFYHVELYWPRELNPVTLPLVGLCLVGWFGAAVGRFGRAAKHLSLLAAAAVLMPALMSLVRKYPFGGVRQTLCIAPFLFAFTAMGWAELARLRVGRWLSIGLAAAYAALWAVNLPRLYEDRVTTCDARVVREVWEQRGKPMIYALGGCQHAVRYRAGRRSGMTIEALPESPPEETSFLLVSTIWPVEGSLWRPALQEEMQSLGYEVTAIRARNPRHPVHPDYIQSLYYPPNGLWIYCVTAAETKGGSPQ